MRDLQQNMVDNIAQMTADKTLYGTDTGEWVSPNFVLNMNFLTFVIIIHSIEYVHSNVSMNTVERASIVHRFNSIFL